MVASGSATYCATFASADENVYSVHAICHHFIAATLRLLFIRRGMNDVIPRLTFCRNILPG